MSWFDFKCMSKFSFHCHTCMLNAVCATILYHWLTYYKEVNKCIDNSHASWINDLVLDLDEMGVLCSSGRLQILSLVIIASVIFILFPSLLRKPHSVGSSEKVIHKAEKSAVNETKNKILLLSYSRWINCSEVVCNEYDAWHVLEVDLHFWETCFPSIPHRLTTSSPSFNTKYLENVTIGSIAQTLSIWLKKLLVELWIVKEKSSVILINSPSGGGVCSAMKQT